MSRITATVLLLLSVSVSYGHDIGVSQAELSESRDENTVSYVLRVVSGPGTSARFPAPELPEQCAFIGNPRGAQGTGWKRFEFACEGGLTPDDTLEMPWQRDGIMLTANWADGSQVRRLFKYDAGLIAVPLAELQVGSGSWLAAAKRYTVLGVEHILEGYDHLLFVFALMLIVSGGWRLVKTITAFTVAHSITLALATLGFVSFPSRPVEAAIALSIAFLAAEIVYARRGRRGLTHSAPWLVAFGFGLLHGFGFAGALADIGLPQSEIPVALLFFNVGVELGQLLFVAASICLLWLLRRLFSGVQLKNPETIALLPAYAIGTVAMYWLLERVAGMLPAA